MILVGFHMMKVNMVESQRLFSHSEKLVYGFELINLWSLTLVMIINTARRLEGCHEFSKCGFWYCWELENEKILRIKPFSFVYHWNLINNEQQSSVTGFLILTKKLLNER